MKKLKSPISVQFEVTESCNNYCRHCYNSFRFGDKKHSSLETKMKIVDEIISAEVFHVVITGGEPLLIKEETFKIMEKLIAANTQVNLNSNLILIDENTAKTLKSLQINGVLASIFHYDPSVHDYQTQNKGSYNNMCNGIELLIKEGVKTSVNMVVTKDTIKDVYETGKVAYKMGVKSFSATRVAPSSDTRSIDKTLNKEDIILLFEQLLALQKDYSMPISSLNPTPYCFLSDTSRYNYLIKRGCAGGSSSATISCDGKIRACQHAKNNDESYSILKEGLINAWLKVKSYKQYLPESCKPCKEKNSCGGGCRESSFVLYGNRNEKDPLAISIPLQKKLFEDKNLTSDKITFHEDILYRKEVNGGVLFRTPASYAILPNKEYELSLSLSRLKQFGISDLAAKTGLPKNNLLSIFNFLYAQNIVREVKNG